MVDRAQLGSANYPRAWRQGSKGAPPPRALLEHPTPTHPVQYDVPSWLKRSIVVQVLQMPIPGRVVGHEPDPAIIDANRVVVQRWHPFYEFNNDAVACCIADPPLAWNAMT